MTPEMAMRIEAAAHSIIELLVRDCAGPIEAIVALSMVRDTLLESADFEDVRVVTIDPKGEN